MLSYFINAANELVFVDLRSNHKEFANLIFLTLRHTDSIPEPPRIQFEEERVKPA